MSTFIYENKNTRSFYVMAWLAFAVSSVGMMTGIFYIAADFAVKGFLAMTYLFSVTACITLAKVIRDKHESEKFINKVESAKTEKFLSESNPVAVG